MNSKLDNEKLTETIVSNICAQLSKRNWSIKMLADKADLPYESVKKLIGGKIERPSFFSIWMIANALGCSVDKLAGRKDPSEAALHQISENTTEIFRILAEMDKLSREVF
ncbi:MAG: helix-turn-helix transcriptional regulator [Eubacteriales bacterium]|nr:helix-turn-helix transcriptional regulator [Eubacteriales bacterium]